LLRLWLLQDLLLYRHRGLLIWLRQCHPECHRQGPAGAGGQFEARHAAERFEDSLHLWKNFHPKLYPQLRHEPQGFWLKDVPHVHVARQVDNQSHAAASRR
jgi:hypothetical protein